MHSFEDLAVPAGSVGIHWFGQSSFAFKAPDGTIVLVDPYFPRVRRPERFLKLTPPLLEESLHTDAVLLTHNHRDHTCLESIERISAAHPSAVFVGPVESESAVRAARIAACEFTVVTAGDVWASGSITVHAVWAKPPDGLLLDGILPPDVTHLGFVLDIDSVVCYVSGDPVNTFAEHDSLLAPVRVLRPEIGFLTTHPTEGEFPFFDGSAKTARRLGLKTAVPSHYACFVRRTYDPHAWAAHLEDVTPLIIPYDGSVVYPVPREHPAIPHIAQP